MRSGDPHMEVDPSQRPLACHLQYIRLPPAQNILRYISLHPVHPVIFLYSGLRRSQSREIRLTSLDKSRATLPSASSTQSLPSLLCASIPRSRNRSLARPSSCFVDFSVTKRSRSRDGRVDGAKCSLRRTLCLIMLSRLRRDSTRESAEPEMLRGPEAL